MDEMKILHQLIILEELMIVMHIFGNHGYQ
jgi:hypothetical protein